MKYVIRQTKVHKLAPVHDEIRFGSQLVPIPGPVHTYRVNFCSGFSSLSSQMHMIHTKLVQCVNLSVITTP